MSANIRTLEGFNIRQVIPGVVAVLILSFFLGGLLELSILFSALLATQIVLFILLFRRPVWAMAALIVGQLTISGSVLPLSPDIQVSVRFLWTAMAIILLVPMLKRKGGIRLGTRARRIITPAIIFFSLATLSNMINTDLSYTFQYLRVTASSLAILILLPAVIDDERDLKLLTIVALITCSISAVFAIVQHYSFIGLPTLTVFEGTYWHGRVPGLTEGPIHLAYMLPTVLLPAVAFYLLKGVGYSFRRILILLIPIMTIAIYFTYTRSGMYALALGLLSMVFLMKGKVKKELFLAVIILGAAFLYYVDMQNNRYTRDITEDYSAASRFVLWEASAKIALDYPVFGIGGSRFREMSEEYSSVISPYDIGNRDVTNILGWQQTHNDFLRVWVSFGTPAALAFFWMFLGIFRNFLDSYRLTSNRFLKALSLGGFAALAAYAMNAATHNVMDSVTLLWILGGLSIATTKLALAKQPATVKELQ